MARSMVNRGFSPKHFEGDERGGTKWPNCKVRIGQRWGKLQCVDFQRENMTVPINSKGLTISGEVVLLVLECEGGEFGGKGCLKHFWVMVEDNPLEKYLQEWPLLYPKRFPGKRVMRDCGCMGRAGMETGERSADQTLAMTLSVNMPDTLKKQVGKLADGRLETQSEIIRELLCRGLVEIENGASLLGHFPEWGKEHRTIVGTKINDVLMGKIRSKVMETRLPISTVAMALMSLGLDQIERGLVEKMKGGRK